YQRRTSCIPVLRQQPKHFEGTLRVGVPSYEKRLADDSREYIRDLIKRPGLVSDPIRHPTSPLDVSRPPRRVGGRIGLDQVNSTNCPPAGVFWVSKLNFYTKILARI